MLYKLKIWGEDRTQCKEKVYGNLKNILERMFSISNVIYEIFMLNTAGNYDEKIDLTKIIDDNILWCVELRVYNVRTPISKKYGTKIKILTFLVNLLNIETENKFNYIRINEMGEFLK